ncbi:MAG: SRPBCC family protein [Candidatus Hydrogenedentota bacterium]
MAFTVDFEVTRTEEVACPYDRVFDVLADVPESVSHFPKVEELEDLGGGVYRWNMQKIGVDKYHIQTIYACKYTSDRGKGRVKWTPVKGQGNATVKGQWTIKALDEATTRFTLKTSGEMEVPLPRLVKMAVAPVVRREFTAMVDRYMENLCATFEKRGKKKRK